MTDELRSAALESKAWPYEEARKLLKRYPDGKPGSEPILFETGYGPSGLPHIGTFNEVLRTTMVRNAFHTLSDLPTRLIAFSDDMDGLRKVPDNVPNKDMLARHLGMPLTRVPDPFGSNESFGAHNNARLRGFLDGFGWYVPQPRNMSHDWDTLIKVNSGVAAWMKVPPLTGIPEAF